MGVVTWSSQRQRTVSTLATKAEYIALSHRAQEGIWIQRFINELIPKNPISCILLLGDNKSSISPTQDPESQHRTKHIDVIYHYICALVEEKELLVK